MKPIFDRDDKITEAMLSGIKEAIKDNIKQYLKDEVDKLVEDVAIDLSKKLYINLLQNKDPFNDARQIRLEVLLGTPDRQKRFNVESETKIVEVVE